MNSPYSDVDRLAEELLRRLGERRPRALLIGRLPHADASCRYVDCGPYEAVVIGVLSPEALLRMPTDPVCDAFLNGIPVWIFPQPYRKGKHAVLLRRELMEAENRLIQFGARPVKCGIPWEAWWNDRRNSDRKSVGDQKM